MRFMVIVLVLMLVFLFYPFYDLYVKRNPFLPHYTLEARSFWTERACEEAAAVKDVAAHRCRASSTWDRMFGAATRYGSSDKLAD